MPTPKTSPRPKADESVSATDQLRNRLGLDADICDRLFNCASAAYTAGEVRRAEQILRGLVELTDDLRVEKLLASCLMVQRRHTEALAAYERLHEKDPSDLYILGGLAELLLHTFRYREAVSHFERLFALDPQGEHPAGNRGRQILAEHLKAVGAAP